MPKFVIEREIAGAGNLTEDQLRDVSLRSLQALGELGPKIQWLHSFVTDDKVYCVYLAPDGATIRCTSGARFRAAAPSRKRTGTRFSPKSSCPRFHKASRWRTRGQWRDQTGVIDH